MGDGRVVCNVRLARRRRQCANIIYRWQHKLFNRCQAFCAHTHSTQHTRQPFSIDLKNSFVLRAAYIRLCQLYTNARLRFVESKPAQFYNMEKPVNCKFVRIVENQIYGHLASQRERFWLCAIHLHVYGRLYECKCARAKLTCFQPSIGHSSGVAPLSTTSLFDFA